MADLAKLKQQHDDYNARLQAKGITLRPYRAPCCGAVLWSRVANTGERWDTLATCPECGELYIKISTDAAILGLRPDADPPTEAGGHDEQHV